MSTVALKFITNPIGVAIIITFLVLILYSCGANSMKIAIYTFIISFLVISLNNSYLLKEFEHERKLEGTFPVRNPFKN